MPQKPNAVLFDLDGTIIRSSIDFRSMKLEVIRTLREYGADTSQLSPNQLNPYLVSEGLSQLRQAGFSTERTEEVKSKLSRVMDTHELKALDKVEPIDGAADTLMELVRWGVRLAVVTRACLRYAEEALERCALKEYVEVVVAREDVEEAKPNPGQLLRALRSLGVRSGEAVYVGDTVIDLESARRAGVRFIAVLSGVSSEEDFRARGAQELIDSLKDLTSHLILGRRKL